MSTARPLALVAPDARAWLIAARAYFDVEPFGEFCWLPSAFVCGRLSIECADAFYGR